jgi:hypothetical protein
MYITDLFNFVKDVFDKDKRVKIVNQGDKIIFAIMERDDIIKKSSSEDVEINVEPVVTNSREANAELRGFARRMQERNATTPENNGYTPTASMTKEEQIEEFLRRMESEPSQSSPKTKTINK